MVKLNRAKIIEFNGIDYAVLRVKHKKRTYPLVFDETIYNVVRKLDRKWKMNEKGAIYTTVTKSGEQTDIYIHEVVKQIQSRLEGSKLDTRPIIHVNRLMFDLRTDNLEYDTTDKEYTKNQKKKKRTTKLPKNSGINISDLPTYLWYIRSSGGHGDRFFVSVDNVDWKSTSSKKVSLRYKLEESKKYLRWLRDDRPDIFNEYSMNGDFNERGNELLKEYVLISRKGGFVNLKMSSMDHNTDKFLRESSKDLTDFERELLDKFDPGANNCLNVNTEFNRFRKRVTDRYIKELPDHCYYREGNVYGADYFYIRNHPDCKNWTGSRSKKKSIKDKFKQLRDKIDSL